MTKKPKFCVVPHGKFKGVYSETLFEHVIKREIKSRMYRVYSTKARALKYYADEQGENTCDVTSVPRPKPDTNVITEVPFLDVYLGTEVIKRNNVLEGYASVYPSGDTTESNFVARVGFESESGKTLFRRNRMYTRNRVELAAVYIALSLIKNDRIRIKTANKYVYKACDKWIHVWPKRRWMYKNKKGIIRNKDILKKIIELRRTKSLRWELVSDRSDGIVVAKKLAREASIKGCDVLRI